MYSFKQAFRDPEHEPFFWQVENASAAALLVHGFPGTPADLHPVGEALHQAGWTVQGLLLPGFGAQIVTFDQYRCEDWQAAVYEALAALKREHKTVLLVGFSLGGALALHVASVEPPSALILLAPFWKLDHVLWSAVPAIRHILPAFPIFKVFKPDFHDPETRAGIRKFMPDADLDDPQVQQAIRDFRLPTRMFDEIRRAGHAGYAAAPNIRIPKLVIQGSDDKLVLPHITRQLVKRLPAPIKYVEVQGEHDLPEFSAPAWPETREVILVFADIARKSNVG